MKRLMNCSMRSSGSVVSSVLNGFKFMVYFSSTNDNMEFENTWLRLHQDWINGNGSREEAGASGMRRSPPRIQRAYAFELSEIVDALYNDVWWVGHIIKVQNKLKYTVNFKTTEELEFEH